MKKQDIVSGEKLIGLDVVNPIYEDLGKIEDFMVDPASGNIVYAVLSFGGFMGFGEKFFAIPWEAFYWDTQDDNRIIINIPKEKLEQAPGFDKDNPPSSARWKFVDEIYTYFGYAPYTSKWQVGKPTEVPTSTVLRGNSGLGNSGKAATFKEGSRITRSRIKDSGIA